MLFRPTGKIDVKILEKKKPVRITGLKFADWTGLEPATSAVTGRHSNQLNYQSNFLFKIFTGCCNSHRK